MSRETAYPTFLAGLAFIFKSPWPFENNDDDNYAKSRLVNLVGACISTRSNIAWKAKLKRCSEKQQEQFNPKHNDRKSFQFIEKQRTSDEIHGQSMKNNEHLTKIIEN